MNTDPDPYMFNVERLTEYCDPWLRLGMEELPKDKAIWIMSQIAEANVFTKYEDRKGWTDHNHWRRIKYFWMNRNHPDTLTPISIDTRCHNGSFGQPVICDGHHRLIASILAGDRYIDAYFGGPEWLCDWLTEKTDKDPYV